MTNTVYEAIKNGYRMIDSASDNGNEIQVGLGIARAIDEGICSREDLFVISKLWNTFHRPSKVKIAVEKTLQDLNLEYLDAYLIQYPIA